VGSVPRHLLQEGAVVIMPRHLLQEGAVVILPRHRLHEVAAAVEEVLLGVMLEAPRHQRRT
jgi:hypothetical protein